MREVIFLGTGYGMPRTSSCSATFIEDETNNILLDVAGGHEIVRQFHSAKKDPRKIKNIFLSHYDSDHILGIVPLVRVFKEIKESVRINIFCSREVREAVESLFTFVAKKHYENAKQFLNFITLTDGLTFVDEKWKLLFFDLKSNKSPQYGCVIEFPDGKKLSFLGDEPLQDQHLPLVSDSAIFIHEAFCLDSQQEDFQPHPKNHSTVREAAINATKARAKKLVLCHMEDKTLATRKEAYFVEAKKEFSGEIFVPLDLDTLHF